MNAKLISICGFGLQFTGISNEYIKNSIGLLNPIKDQFNTYNTDLRYRNLQNDFYSVDVFLIIIMGGGYRCSKVISNIATRRSWIGFLAWDL